MKAAFRAKIILDIFFLINLLMLFEQSYISLFQTCVKTVFFYPTAKVYDDPRHTAGQRTPLHSLLSTIFFILVAARFQNVWKTLF